MQYQVLQIQDYQRKDRLKIKQNIVENSPETLKQMQNELLYLRQEVDFLKKSIKKGKGSIINNTSYKFQIIFDMINKENNILRVTELCDIAGVSRSGY